jgi:molybdenum cofactor biosynthesis protein B
MAETSHTKEKHTKDRKIPIRAVLLMVGDTLAAASDELRMKLDKSGDIAEELIKAKQFEVLTKQYVADEQHELTKIIQEFVNQNPELIITIGGTGPSPRDVTIESVRPIFNKELPGFGELFRYLTYKEVGTVSIMTRALAGVINQTAIVCLPGSPNAVKLGVPLILEEIVHLINMVRKPNIGPMPSDKF